MISLAAAMAAFGNLQGARKTCEKTGQMVKTLHSRDKEKPCKFVISVGFPHTKTPGGKSQSGRFDIRIAN
jgi:hypothetical protein